MSKGSLRVLILEDDPILRMNTEEVLISKGIDISASVANGQKAISAFREDPPDLAIVDIHLEGSMLDGIQSAIAFNEIQRVPIIFLTALADERIRERAKMVNPAYYLIKPCTPVQLEVAIDMAFDNFTGHKEAIIDHSLKANKVNLESLYTISNSFFIKTKRKYQRIYADQILWIEAANSSVVVNTTEGKFVFSANLKSFYQQFRHPDLIKIHRSYIVNKEKVSAFDDNCVQLVHKSDLFNLPIGQTYKKTVDNAFLKLRSGH